MPFLSKCSVLYILVAASCLFYRCSCFDSEPGFSSNVWDAVSWHGGLEVFSVLASQVEHLKECHDRLKCTHLHWDERINSFEGLNASLLMSVTFVCTWIELFNTFFLIGTLGFKANVSKTAVLSLSKDPYSSICPAGSVSPESHLSWKHRISLFSESLMFQLYTIDSVIKQKWHRADLTIKLLSISVCSALSNAHVVQLLPDYWYQCTQCAGFPPLH